MLNLIESTYTGETSRTLYCRSLQHRQDYSKCSRPDSSDDPGSSWMWDHSLEVHGAEVDAETDYVFSIIAKHRDPLSRQTEEAVRIVQALEKRTLSDHKSIDRTIIPLNRKGEHFALSENREISR